MAAAVSELVQTVQCQVLKFSCYTSAEILKPACHVSVWFVMLIAEFWWLKFLICDSLLHFGRHRDEIWNIWYMFLLFICSSDLCPASLYISVIRSISVRNKCMPGAATGQRWLPLHSSTLCCAVPGFTTLLSKINSIRFWRWRMIIRINVLLDCVHRPRFHKTWISLCFGDWL
jgi:hypothetical protein